MSKWTCAQKVTLWEALSHSTDFTLIFIHALSAEESDFMPQKKNSWSVLYAEECITLMKHVSTVRSIKPLTYQQYDSIIKYHSLWLTPEGLYFYYSYNAWKKITGTIWHKRRTKTAIQSMVRNPWGNYTPPQNSLYVFPPFQQAWWDSFTDHWSTSI